MTRLYAIVEAGETGVSGVLAGEALRRAAKRRDQPLEIELRSAQGVINPVTPGADEALLFVAPEGASDPSIEARASSPDHRGGAGRSRCGARFGAESAC
jgi:PTS system fructose-specific IIC component